MFGISVLTQPDLCIRLALHPSGRSSFPAGARVVKGGGGRHPGDGVQAFMVARSFPLMAVNLHGRPGGNVPYVVVQ